MWIANAQRIREIDRLATEEYGIPASVLMERAGAAAFEVLKNLLPHGGHISVFCGKGNNGGDGFVVARRAKEKHYGVDCLVAANESELKGEALEQCKALRASGVEPIFYNEERWISYADCVGCRDLVVDALLGTGARCEVTGPIKVAIESINRAGVPILSIDLPSGIACDTGEELGKSVWAFRTVTFGLPKPFLFQGLGVEHAGYWEVADIGYPMSLTKEPTDAFLLENEWICQFLPERMKASQKGDNGHVLVVAGCDTMTGAAVLCARAALRAGAGLVTVASTPHVCRVVNASLPEALTLPLPEHQGTLSAHSAEAILERVDRYSSAVFGPGLSHTKAVHEFLGKIWQDWNLPTVVDADALNAVSDGVRLPEGDCILLPHPGEMSRLLSSSVAEILADRFQTVQMAVDRFDKTVLLKGPYSIVGQTGEPMLVNSTGNPGMATGGMGDVLAGMAGTLLAQDLPSYYALACAVYWHGLAADLCANDIGPIGYTATEVSNMLPSARVKIVESCVQKYSC